MEKKCYVVLRFTSVAHRIENLLRRKSEHIHINILVIGHDGPARVRLVLKLSLEFI